MDKIDRDIISALQRKGMTIGELIVKFGFTRKQMRDKLIKFEREGYRIRQVGNKQTATHKNVAMYKCEGIRVTMGNKNKFQTPISLPEKPLRWFDCLPIGS